MGRLARSVKHAKVALERGYLGLILGFDWMLMERAAEPAREIKQQLLR